MGSIIQGLRSREPALDILDVKSAGLRGTKDPQLLEIAAEQGRILITHDRNTMPGYLRDRLAAGKSSPGLLSFPIGRVPLVPRSNGCFLCGEHLSRTSGGTGLSS